MHHLRLVHVDLKGVGFPSARFRHISHLSTKANILVNRDRHACIADFGLSTITGVRTHSATRNSGIASPSSPPPNDSLVSFTPGWSIRWVSPELLDPGRFGVPESEDDRPTRESDCYAMGMVIYEVSFYADKAVEVFNRGPGIMWTRPIPSHSTGCCGHRGDLERGSTEETR